MQVCKALSLDVFIHSYIFILCVLGYQGGVNGLTCGGDSGSPLVIFNSREMHYVQVGIVSGGSCQSFTDPAIFARIEDRQTLEFITKQFWDHIPPTGVKAIERLMAENKVFARDINDLKEKVKKLSIENVELEGKNTRLIKQIVSSLHSYNFFPRIDWNIFYLL